MFFCRSSGICEACKRVAPFKTSSGRQYLEPHHIYRLSDGGPDAPGCVAAVCPNCHKEIHYGLKGKSINEQLIRYVSNIEE